MKKLLLFLTMLASLAQAKELPPITVYAFSEDVGKELIDWRSPAEDGYLHWMREGYKALGCEGSKFSQYYMTPCMIQVLFHSLETDLGKLGLASHFAYTVKYVDFQDYDVKCRADRCVAEIARLWKERHLSPGLDILLLPKQNGVQGHTRGVSHIQKGKTVVALVAGKAQSYQTAHLFRHEMAHAMGFNMHLYDSKAWTFNADGKYNCPRLAVKPFDLAGIKRSCVYRTFLGDYSPHGETCTRLSASDPKLHARAFAVPYYGDKFKHVFGCWLAENSTVEPPKPAPKPPTKPEPTPTPKPDPKGYHKYCPNWLQLVEKYQCTK